MNIPSKIDCGKVNSHKRPLILMEVLIAIFLLSFLMASIFVGFHLVTAADHLNEKLIKREETISNAYQCLSRIFSQVVLYPETSVDPIKKEEPIYFYTAETTLLSGASTQLVFTFNNGIDRDPRFSNEVLAKIYVDSNHCLCLAIWPLPNRWKIRTPNVMRKEVLMDDVSTLRFKFYQPPRLSRMEVDADLVTSDKKKTILPGEHSEWLKEYACLPRIVKLEITQKKENNNPQQQPIVFSYLLPDTRKAIFIKKEKAS